MINNKKMVDAFNLINKSLKDTLVQIVTKEGKLYLQAVDTSYELIIELGETHVELDHKLVDDFKDVNKSMKFLKGDFEINYNDDLLKLKSGDKELILNVIESTVPLEIRTGDIIHPNYNFENLKTRLLGVEKMRGNDLVRTQINGIHFNKSDIVALDGYSLGLTKDEELRFNNPITLDKQATDHLYKIIKAIKGVEEVTISQFNNNLIFTFDNVMLKLKQLDTSFFDYTAITDNLKNFNYDIKLTDVNVKKLMDNHKFLESMSEVVTMENDSENLTISTISGDAKVHLDYNIKDEVLIAYNPKLMVDTLNSISKLVDTVDVHIDSSLNPIHLTNSNIHYLILPVRIQN